MRIRNDWQFRQWWYAENVRLLQTLYPEQRVSWDREEFTWVMLPNFQLPPGWTPRTSALLVRLPGLQSPLTTPPRDFHIDPNLHHRDGRLMNHYFPGSAHVSAPGWAWFCLGLEGWSPSTDLVSGDNLLNVIDVIYTKLTRHQ